jgi:hypothetical protein
VGSGAGELAEGEERCRRRLVSNTKDDLAGSMLPVPLQFLAAWRGRVLQRMRTEDASGVREKRLQIA